MWGVRLESYVGLELVEFGVKLYMWNEGNCRVYY